MSLISIINQQRYDTGYRASIVTFTVAGGVITGIALS